MNYKAIVLSILMFLGVTGCIQKPQKVKPKPNLLFVMADQFRRQSLGFMNEEPVLTPHLDNFAKQGLVFTNAVSSFPVCTPFRAMLMTGKYPLSTGMTANCMPGIDLELLKDEICFGDVLKESGYSTGYIGKWHLENPSLNKYEITPDSAGMGELGWAGKWDAWTPPDRRHGFDFWYAYNTFDLHFQPHYWTEDLPRKKEVRDWSVKHETEVAIDFITKQNPDKPFALFLSWNPPHPGYMAPKEFKDLYKDIDLFPRKNNPADHMKNSRMLYYAGISGCDHYFGELLKTLEEKGIADNTIVIFTSDHGDMLGSHGRYSKGIWYEESIGIPFMVRWPKQIAAGKENMVFGNCHFMPTILGLMGLDIPQTTEGHDYSNIILGKEGKKAKDALLFWYNTPTDRFSKQQNDYGGIQGIVALSEYEEYNWKTFGYRGLRTEKYTYIVDRYSEISAANSPGNILHPLRPPLNIENIINSVSEGNNYIYYLYDNENDPYQMNPTITTNPDEYPTMKKLNERLVARLKEINDPFPL